MSTSTNFHSYRRLCRLIKYLIRWIKRKGIKGLKLRLKKAFAWYFGFEFLFFCRWSYLRRYINKYIPNTVIPTKQITMNHEYMQRLACLSHEYSKMHENGSRGWLEEWFNNCDISEIYRENMSEWLYSGLFNAKPESPCNQSLTQQEIQWRDDYVNSIISNIENETGHKFQKGYNHKVKYMSAEPDAPIKSIYHPFIIYIVLFLTQKFSDFYYYFILKFEYQWINGLKVWYKLPTKNNNVENEPKPKPLLIMHGIGIYLLPYIRFIETILAKNPNQAIICIEIPWITVTASNYLGYGSSYIGHKLPCESIDFVLIMSELEMMLMERQNIYHQHINNQMLQLEWTLCGHSYGSFIVSAIYKYCKNNENENVIPRLILIDPVSLCTSHPTTTALFAKPASDWQTYALQLFAVQELQISCTLSRYLAWFKFVLYPDDLIHDNCNHIVCIGSKDKVIPFDIINQGINKVNNECGHDQIERIVFEKGHAEWLSSQHCINQIVNKL